MMTGKDRINYGYLTVSKCCLPLQHIVRYRQTNSHVDGQTDRQTGIERQTDGDVDRQKDIQKGM